MKIVEAISDTNVGGAGVLLLTRLTSSKEYARCTTVLIPKGSALKNRLSGQNIDFIEIDARGDRSFDIVSIPKYIKLLKKLSPDVINCHGCLSCRIAALICNIPARLYTRHCVFPVSSFQTSKFYKKINRFIQNILSHHIIAVADSAKNDLLKMGSDPQRISVVINGVRGFEKMSENDRKKTRATLGIPEDSTVVSIFARLEAYKGHECFLSAAELLIKESDKYRFLIVGDGAETKKLKSLCKSKGLDSFIIFTGFIDNVEPYFNITDINVNCSTGTETSSLALSEGMSLSIPCVVSDYGGNTYMVKDGVNGFIFPQNDYRALAEKIKLLASDRELYGKMSKNAYKRFKDELNAEKMSKETYAIYERVCRDQMSRDIR